MAAQVDSLGLVAMGGMIPDEIPIVMAEAVTIVTGIMIGGTVTVKAGVHEMVRDDL